MKPASLLGRWLLALVIAVGAAGAAPVHAGSASPPRPLEPRIALATSALPVCAASTTRLGGFLQDVVGNRSRLIQVSFVFIIIGIFILWKK
jgi:hypothetical protein